MSEPLCDPGCDDVVDGRYTVVAHLADGGMGSVFVAHDNRLERDVALKILRSDLARDPACVERFRREARSVARLSHPAVVAVHDQGDDGRHVFLAMELVRGQTLRDVIRAGGLSVADALYLIDQVLDGLAAAHQAGIVHRDVKPENVLIDEEGRVKVADFGLARTVSAGGMTKDSDVLIGTASYLAPEQVQHGIVDPRSDVYAAGLMIFELLTGQRAFDGDVPIHVAYRHVHGSMPRLADVAPALAPAFDGLLLRACSKNPLERPPSAAFLRDELRSLRAQLPADVLAHRSPPQRRTVTAEDQTAHEPGAPERLHETAALARGATQALPAAPVAAAPRRRPLWWYVLPAVLVAVTAWVFLLGPLAPVTVPDVRGATQGQAVDTLRAAGLHVTLKQADDDTVPSGQVIRTTPEAGTRQRANSDVTVIMSTGPKMVAVPDVRGRDVQAARSHLEQNGLRVGALHEISSAAPKGQVMGTQPATGARVRHGADVVVLVSKGSEPVDVPDLSGMSEAEARTRLRALGLEVRVRQEPDADVPAGEVLSVSPPAGATVHTGDTITLTVSSGPEMTDVPDVVGLTARQARASLEAAGFEVGGVTVLDDLLNSIVVSQSPEGGSGHQAPKGSRVELTF